MPEAAKTTRSRGRPRNEVGDSAAADVLRELGARNTLDRDHRAPLWVQLKNQIGDAITKSALAPHARLPSEQTICEIFDVSRPVVRSALSALAADGRLIRMPRKGVFIAPPRQETDFATANLSVHADLTARGHDVTAKTFLFGRFPPDEAEQRFLGVPPNGTVIRIGRVYFSDGQPLTYTQISLPGHKVPGMEKLDIEGHSVFSTLREHYGLVAHRAERWLTAAMPHAEAAELMGVPITEPMIWIESVAYDPSGAPLEFYRAFYNSATAKIHVTIAGNGVPLTE